jgi:tRNA dimethylallyltransferase
VPDTARSEAAAALERLGEEAFRQALGCVDPEAARRIAAGDRQRLVRAWAVREHTGRPLSDWQADTRPALRPGEWRAVALEPPRAALYDRIDARVPEMIETGALEEVRALLARDLPPDLPLMKAVGVRALAGRLAGALSLEAAIEDIRQETRRYAKRQLTWFRNQAAEWPRLDLFTPNSSGLPQGWS